MLYSAQYDFLACGGYCPDFIEKNIHEAYGKSKNVTAYWHPDAAHGFNFNVSLQDIRLLAIRS